MEDTRNVIDVFKGMPIDEITAELDSRAMSLEVAVENTQRDFNMGTIVRSANAFGVRHVHVIGRKQWNKRGAMMTDKYVHVHYYAVLADFLAEMNTRGLTVIAVDNIAGSQPLAETKLPEKVVLVFGQEGPGVSEALAESASKIVAVEQFGSTRSINVGVAAGIVMYSWLQQHVLST